MTTRTALPTKLTVPTAAASKADEIQFLIDLHEAMPADTYLGGLFSAGFVGWANAHIQDDVCPDAIGLINSLRDSQASDRASLIVDGENIKSLRNALDAVQQERNREADEYERRIDSLRNDYDQACGRAMNAEYELEQARKQIAALKIELFNREHPELA